jgi:hypothetical protein
MITIVALLSAGLHVVIAVFQVLLVAGKPWGECEGRSRPAADPPSPSLLAMRATHILSRYLNPAR